ncbi:MAG TPA: hypothetical protein VJ822_17890 [Dongiaceae bacterium]|nr:hypothetical protein [Dongiaceae bacterium]
MAGSQRQWLRKAIKRHLLPAFEQRGFSIVPLSDAELSDRENRSTFPFGRLRRANSRAFEVVEIQLAPYGDPALRLNVGVVPNEGYTFSWGHAAAEDFPVTGLQDFYVLYPSPRTRRWFKVRRWPWTKVIEADYDTLVKGIVDLIPEVEQIFNDGTSGPHVRHTRMPWTTSTAKN